MINSVSFTGRETMLINAAKKAAESKIGQQAKDASSAINAIYTSPFAPIADAVGKCLNKIV